MNPRNLFTERIRRSRQEAPQQESPTTGHQSFSSVTHYTKKVKIPKFQISPVLRTLKVSSLNASEKSRQQVHQQQTPNTGHETPSAGTPYITWERCLNFKSLLFR
jgi:hypothetical protein